MFTVKSNTVLMPSGNDQLLTSERAFNPDNQIKEGLTSDEDDEAEGGGLRYEPKVAEKQEDIYGSRSVSTFGYTKPFGDNQQPQQQPKSLETYQDRLLRTSSTSSTTTITTTSYQPQASTSQDSSFANKGSFFSSTVW